MDYTTNRSVCPVFVARISRRYRTFCCSRQYAAYNSSANMSDNLSCPSNTSVTVNTLSTVAPFLLRGFLVFFVFSNMFTPLLRLFPFFKTLAEYYPHAKALLATMLAVQAFLVVLYPVRLGVYKKRPLCFVSLAQRIHVCTPRFLVVLAPCFLAVFASA